MPIVFKVPEGTKEYEVKDEKIEVLILNADLERLDIKYAPSLKKIISFSDCVTFGPREEEIGLPILNNCSFINEIITFGQIKFNTLVQVKGKSVPCAQINSDLPILTSVGKEYLHDFPFYSINIPEEKVEPIIPIIRDVNHLVGEALIFTAVNNPTEIAEIDVNKTVRKFN